MKRIVLDASAVVTFFEGRPGAGQVEEIINLAMEGKRELLMSVVNWGEVYYSAWRASGPDAAKKTAAEIAQLSIEIVDADIELTCLAAEFRAQHKLPYADCFAAALAKHSKASLAVADSDFSLIREQVNLIWLKGS